MKTMQPLKSIPIVTLEHAMAAPFASHFVWTNRSKKSLALDVKHPQAQGRSADQIAALRVEGAIG